MTEIVLHIGAPKCGSSSLQRVLSEHPDFVGQDGRRYAYVIPGDGTPLLGAAISEAAARSPYGYLCAPTVTAGADGDAWLRGLPASLEELWSRGITPVLSSESWLYFGRTFRLSGVFDPQRTRLHAVAFVRPPVDWLNSSWWQWGVWSDVDIHRYLSKNLDQARWNKWLDAWLRIPALDRLTVIPSAAGVVERFFGALNAPAPRSERINVGPSTALLGFLLRNREFRPGPHSSWNEFVFERHIPREAAARPWAIPPEAIRQVTDLLAPANRNLLDKLDPSDRRSVENDPRWWSADAYRAEQEFLPADPTAVGELMGLERDLRAALGRLGDTTSPSVRPISERDDLETADRTIAALTQRLIGHDALARA